MLKNTTAKGNEMTKQTTREAFTDSHGHFASTIYHHCGCGMAVALTGRPTQDAAALMEHQRVFHPADFGQQTVLGR